MPRVADDRVVQPEGVPEQGDRLGWLPVRTVVAGWRRSLASTSSNAEAAPAGVDAENRWTA
jgi:hypothetical protein